MKQVLSLLHRRAEDIAVALLAAMFSAFVLQIVSRYVIREPLGWTLEACLLTWLWLIFWSAAFLVRDKEHVRFEILYVGAGPRLRRVFGLISAVALVAAFGISFPATYDFISFMKIEKSSTLGIRLDYVFGIYLLFAAVIVLRYSWRAIKALRGAALEGDGANDSE
ncbi:MAG: TRAP transporter small permease subunit [Hyphomicrobiales bacterium]